jgi:hypothetical protein
MRNLKYLVVAAALGRWVAFPTVSSVTSITGIVTGIDKNGGG